MPVTKTQLLVLGVLFLAIGFYWIAMKGRKPFSENKPGVTYRLAGGILATLGLLCAALWLFW